MTSRKFILNLAPTGMIPTKEMHPGVPLEPEEIIDQVLEGVELGANMVHLHAREPDTGTPCCRKEIYAEIISGIRKKNREVVVGVSTSGRHLGEFEKRSEPLELRGELKPDFGILTSRPVSTNLR